MAVNDDLLGYYDKWDIDQLVLTDEMAVGSGVTQIVALPNTSILASFEVYLKPSGATAYFQSGGSNYLNTVASAFDFNTYIQNGALYINSTIGGTVRYYIWADKVDY